MVGGTYDSTCSCTCNCHSGCYDGTAAVNTCGCCSQQSVLLYVQPVPVDLIEKAIRQIWEVVMVICCMIPPLLHYIECKARAPPSSSNLQTKTKNFYTKGLYDIQGPFLYLHMTKPLRSTFSTPSCPSSVQQGVNPSLLIAYNYTAHRHIK